uniref:Uncharacterized protein n=1 Tax=Arundo donax TaxID=35708 RepID=A0A0A9HBZ1_ARUDO
MHVFASFVSMLPLKKTDSVEGTSDSLAPRTPPLLSAIEPSFCSEVDGLSFIVCDEGWTFVISSPFIRAVSPALECSAFDGGLVAGETKQIAFSDFWPKVEVEHSIGYSPGVTTSSFQGISGSSVFNLHSTYRPGQGTSNEVGIKIIPETSPTLFFTWSESM